MVTSVLVKEALVLRGGGTELVDVGNNWSRCSLGRGERVTECLQNVPSVITGFTRFLCPRIAPIGFYAVNSFSLCRKYLTVFYVLK